MRRMLGVVVVAAGLIGCGGDDDGGDRLTKAELIEQGDAICATAVEEATPIFTELFPSGTETPSAEEAAEPMAAAAEILRTELDDFEELVPPEDDEDEFEAIVDAFEAAIVEFERSAELAADGDTEGYLQSLEKANQLDAESRELMAAYGFTVCAGG